MTASVTFAGPRGRGYAAMRPGFGRPVGRYAGMPGTFRGWNGAASSGRFRNWNGNWNGRRYGWNGNWHGNNWHGHWNGCNNVAFYGGGFGYYPWYAWSYPYPYLLRLLLPVWRIPSRVL